MIRVIIPCLLLVAIFFDGERIYLPWELESLDKTIIYGLRLPRTLLSFFVGGSLSLCGLIYQSLFKNDLASPFTLGTASSSSFGACLALFIGLGSFVNVFSITAALINLLIILFIFKKQKTYLGHVILLTGVILSYFFSSLVMLLQVLSDKAQLRQMIFWILGDLNTVGSTSALTSAIVSVALLVVFYLYSKDLSLLAVGETFAKNNGVHVEKTRTVLLIVSSITVAVLVAICGPIGFVGIIIPHFVKQFKGARIDRIGFDTFLCGGTFLALCEYGAQSLFSHNVIPVGIVTSFLGAPFFLMKLLRRKFH
jgi:iron complex transport system permease protein